MKYTLIKKIPEKHHILHASEDPWKARNSIANVNNDPTPTARPNGKA